MRSSGSSRASSSARSRAGASCCGAPGLPSRASRCAASIRTRASGLFGRGEEETKIEPAIEACRARGWKVDGPLPADTLFFRARRGDFDLVVAMYHDQGHAPVKALSFDVGVNVTVGLPFVRTSVDHGTAFDIAGTGEADERSMLEALRQAVKLTPRPSCSARTSPLPYLRLAMVTRRRFLVSGLATAASASLDRSAFAQEAYPSRPIRMIVPHPRAAVSTSWRAISASRCAAARPAFVVENKPGANGMIGAQQAASAAPDGYTLLMASAGRDRHQPASLPKR